MTQKRQLKNSLLSMLILSLLVVLSPSCKTQNIYTSSWAENPNKLPKQVNDLQYNTDTKMLYGIFNDKENLYLVLRVTDKTVQKKILMGGLTFWMDTIGKKKKQFGITFPQAGSMKNRFAKMDKQQMMQQMQGGGMQQTINYAEINQKFSSGLNDMKIVGFNHKKDPQIVFNKSTNGINTSLRFDDMGTLHYRSSIPIKLVFSNPEAFLNNPDKLFSFGFETGAVDMPTMTQGGKPGGGMSGGGGMKGGGMHGGSMPSGGMSGMQELSKPSKFWIKSTRLIKIN